MANGIDFSCAALAPTRDSELLVRIALNLLVNPEEYPVDVSELRALRPAGRAMVAAFLCNGGYATDSDVQRKLIAMLEERFDGSWVFRVQALGNVQASTESTSATS